MNQLSHFYRATTQNGIQRSVQIDEWSLKRCQAAKGLQKESQNKSMGLYYSPESNKHTHHLGGTNVPFCVYDICPTF